MAACPRCGEANPARARFCLACGAPIEELAAPREMRKTVTIVFSDVIDSTPLGEQLDAETYRRIMSRYFIEMSRVLEHHGGTVEKFIGDAVMAVFGIPVVHEDDALRAVRAAAELREALAELNGELRSEFDIELAVRTGINTGEVVASDAADGQSFATGEAVVVAQRLESSASPGEILIGEATQRLVRNAVLVEPLDPLSVKGKAEPAPAWRLLAVVSGAPGFARRLDSPLVGRGRELALLDQAFRRAVDERACHLFTILGAAGVGKSRLVNELVANLGAEERVLVGRCVPYGEGITLWPLAELVRQAGSITPRDSPEAARRKLASLLFAEPDAELVADRIAAATGLAEGDASNEETFWAVRKLLEAMAQEQPLVVGFDDVQWAEPTFLDLIDYLADRSRNAPLLLVCLARPELLDERPAWGGGKLNATSILLEPLGETDIEELIENLLGEGDIAAEVLRSLREASEGNPLFVEEMLAMLVDEGALKQENGSWRAADELGKITTPPTIQALLAARLGRLSHEDRAVLECASVIGKLFSREALGALMPEAEALDDRLASLVRKDLIRPDRADDSFLFRHILIRDAAYQGLAKELRAELHERFAAWLEEARRDRLREYEEILGYHLEQAHRHRAELGPQDERMAKLARRAAGLLASAGRRALDRGDMPAAAGLLTRATLLQSADELEAGRLAPDLATALIDLGELARAEGILSRAAEAARTGDDRGLQLRAELLHAVVRLRLNPEVGTDDLRVTAERAISAFEELGDEEGLARAWLSLSDVHWMASQWASRTEALEQALVHARRAGARRQEKWILGSLALSLTWGSAPFSEAIQRCEEILAEFEGDRLLEARVLVILAECKAPLGQFDEARELYRRSKGILEDLGLKLLPALHTLTGGAIELLAGAPEAAVVELRAGYETLQSIGEKVSLATVAADLSEALYAQGVYQEADRFAEIAETTAPQEDVTSQVVAHGTQAKLLARRGDAERAESVAREAVDQAARTDAINMHADALMNLAEVLRLSGREDEARTVFQEATELYERKGNVVWQKRAAALATGAVSL